MVIGTTTRTRTKTITRTRTRARPRTITRTRARRGTITRTRTTTTTTTTAATTATTVTTVTTRTRYEQQPQPRQPVCLPFVCTLGRDKNRSPPCCFTAPPPPPPNNNNTMPTACGGLHGFAKDIQGLSMDFPGLSIDFPGLSIDFHGFQGISKNSREFARIFRGFLVCQRAYGVVDVRASRLGTCSLLVLRFCGVCLGFSSELQRLKPTLSKALRSVENPFQIQKNPLNAILNTIKTLTTPNSEPH